MMEDNTNAPVPAPTLAYLEMSESPETPPKAFLFGGVSGAVHSVARKLWPGIVP